MRDLPTTTAVADSLVDFRFANDSPEYKKSKGWQEGNSSRDGGKKNGG